MTKEILATVPCNECKKHVELTGVTCSECVKTKSDKITITKWEYFGLKKDEEELLALQCAGVDNWSGGEEADYEAVDYWQKKMDEIKRST